MGDKIRVFFWWAAVVVIAVLTVSWFYHAVPLDVSIGARPTPPAPPPKIEDTPNVVIDDPRPLAGGHLSIQEAANRSTWIVIARVVDPDTPPSDCYQVPSYSPWNRYSDTDESVIESIIHTEYTTTMKLDRTLYGTELDGSFICFFDVVNFKIIGNDYSPYNRLSMRERSLRSMERPAVQNERLILFLRKKRGLGDSHTPVFSVVKAIHDSPSAEEETRNALRYRHTESDTNEMVPPLTG